MATVKIALAFVLLACWVSFVVSDCRLLETSVMPQVCSRCYTEMTCGMGFATCGQSICRFWAGIRACDTEGSIKDEIAVLRGYAQRFERDYQDHCDSSFRLDHCNTPYYTPVPGKDGGSTPLPGYERSKVHFGRDFVEKPEFCRPLPVEEVDDSSAVSSFGARSIFLATFLLGLFTLIYRQHL